MDASVENRTLEDILVWLQTVDPAKEITLENIMTGRPVAEILYKIDPSFFTSEWLDKIPRFEKSANWRVKGNLMHKIFCGLHEYYGDCLGVKLTGEWMIDPVRMVEHNDSAQLCQMLKLVVGAAMLGPNNKEFLTRLLLEKYSVQETVAFAVQNLRELIPKSANEEVGNANASTAVVGDLKRELATMKNNVESLEQERLKLNEKLKELCSEKEALSSDNESLRLRVDELNVESTEVSLLKKKIESLRSTNENLKDALYKAEAEIDHFKTINSHLHDENSDLQLRVQRLIPFETDLNRLRDELEEYRLRAEDCEKLDSQINSYKAKIKECNAQKVEMKVLKEKLVTYMESAVALEDEQRKNGVLKTHIESLRLENAELNAKLGDEIRRADKAEFECKQLSERIVEIEKERDHLRREGHKLNEQLLLRDDYDAPSLHDETNNAILNTTLREQIIGLEKKEERLLAEKAKNEGELSLKEQIFLLTTEKKSLETELKLAQIKINDLQKRLKETNEIVDSANFLNNGRLTEQQTTNEKMGLLIAQLEARLEHSCRDLEHAVEEKRIINEELTATKQLVENEKAKLKLYMEKARRMIEDLEEQSRAVEGGALSRHEFDSIRRERDTYKQTIEALKESQERSRRMQEEEQRLFTTHAYYLMMQLQQQNSSMGRNSDEKSFLTRQRQCGGFNFMR